MVIMIRSEFPLVKIEDLTDEEFAIYANDAKWLMEYKAKLSLGGLSAGGDANGKPQSRRPVPRRR